MFSLWLFAGKALLQPFSFLTLVARTLRVWLSSWSWRYTGLPAWMLLSSPQSYDLQFYIAVNMSFAGVISHC